jgi:hypothetical protein
VLEVVDDLGVRVADLDWRRWAAGRRRRRSGRPPSPGRRSSARRSSRRSAAICALAGGFRGAAPADVPIPTPTAPDATRAETVMTAARLRIWRFMKTPVRWKYLRWGCSACCGSDSSLSSRRSGAVQRTCRADPTHGRLTPCEGVVTGVRGCRGG